MSSVLAMVIKLKNENCVVTGVCTSSREVLAGWLMVTAGVVVFFKFFFAIDKGMAVVGGYS
jgi:hypothetical protein